MPDTTDTPTAPSLSAEHERRMHHYMRLGRNAHTPEAAAGFAQAAAGFAIAAALERKLEASTAPAPLRISGNPTLEDMEAIRVLFPHGQRLDTSHER